MHVPQLSTSHLSEWENLNLFQYLTLINLLRQMKKTTFIQTFSVFYHVIDIDGLLG